MSERLPDKLYIPTSTINFGAFMATESISPKAFYAERKFGAPQFEPVGPNALTNCILLYEKCPKFDVDESKEHYPLVIEIETRYVPEDTIEKKDGVFVTGRTIYLSPSSTRFIFQTEEARQDAKSRAERNVTSKLWPLYEKRCVLLKEAKVGTKDWKGNGKLPSDVKEMNRAAISRDRKINKLKGCLYGYVLGMMNTVSDDVAHLKKNVKDLRNEVSSIANKGFPTGDDQQRLGRLYSDINYGFYAQCGKKEFLEKFPGDNYGGLEAWLRGDGKNYWSNYIRVAEAAIGKKIYQLSEFSFGRMEPEEGDAYWEHLEEALANISRNVPPEEKNLPDAQGLQISQIEGDAFLKNLLNAFLDEAYNGEEYGSACKEEYPQVVERILQDEMGDAWEGSKEKVYLESLKKSLKSLIAPFEIHGIEGTHALALKSFAGFCKRGGTIDKLTAYMEECEIGQLQIVYALWGSIFGFSEMPKTLTNGLFGYTKKDDIWAIYKRVFKQTVGLDLDDLKGSENDKKGVEGRAQVDAKRGSVEKIEQEKKCPCTEEKKEKLGEAEVRESLHESLRAVRVDVPTRGEKKQGETPIQGEIDFNAAENSKKDVTSIQGKGNEKLYFYNDAGAWDYMKKIVPEGDQNA